MSSTSILVRVNSVGIVSGLLLGSAGCGRGAAQRPTFTTPDRLAPGQTGPQSAAATVGPGNAGLTGNRSFAPSGK